MATITVSEIMTTKPRTVHEDDSVLLTDWLLDLDGIHHVVVVDADQRVVGIVSDRDILRAFGSKPSGELPIGDFMKRDVQTIAPDAAANMALDRMLAGRFHALPVVDADRRLIGIVTASDFLDVARWALYRLDARAPNASAHQSAE
jgi:CBS-domain-containing membrane protein